MCRRVSAAVSKSVSCCVEKCQLLCRKVSAAVSKSVSCCVSESTVVLKKNQLRCCVL